jgi:hypothetical protein
MLDLRRFIYSLLLTLALCGAAINVEGQREVKASRGNTAAERIDSRLSNERLQPDARQDPILLSIRAGEFELADLIGPDPLDTDAVIVQVRGVKHSFKLNEVRIQSQARKFDDYGKIASNDTKARLDNFAVTLQSEPTSTGYILVYGSCIDESRAQSKRAKDYLVNFRGIDSSRLLTVDGGCRKDFTVELWIAPSGASAPAHSPEGLIAPCPKCPKPKKSNRKSRRR